MKWVNLHWYGLGAVMTLVLMFAAGCQSPAPPVNEPNFKDVVKNSSITIYPTVVADPVMPGQATYHPDEARKLGEWVALTSNITIKYSDDRLRSVTPWDAEYHGARDGIEALKAHVQANPVTTDFAVAAVYQIYPEGGGATAIYMFMVTKDGKLARWFWSNRRNKGFRDASPRTPADCTNLLVNIIDDRVRIMEQTEQMYRKSE